MSCCIRYRLHRVNHCGSVKEGRLFSEPPSKLQRLNTGDANRSKCSGLTNLEPCFLRHLVITDLPTHLLMRIFSVSSIGILDQLRLASVCTKFLEAIRSLWENLICLNLDLSECEDEKLSSLTILTLISKCSNLKHLSLRLSSCLYEDMVDNAAIFQVIAASAPHLKSFHFLLTQMETTFLDIGLNVLCHSCNYLTEIGLENSAATDASLQIIAEHMPTLESIMLKCCWFIKDDGFLQILRKCPSLWKVDVSYSKGITNRSIQELITLFEERATKKHLSTVSNSGTVVEHRYKLRPRKSTVDQSAQQGRLDPLVSLTTAPPSSNYLYLQLQYSGCDCTALRRDERLVFIKAQPTVALVQFDVFHSKLQSSSNSESSQ